MNIKEFWNDRAKLGLTSGSNDFILKRLEQKEIFKYIRNNTHILEVGCGNGETLTTLAEKKGCTGIGIDYAEKMIEAANEHNFKEEKISFKVDQLPGLDIDEKFDYIISQRCLINLTNLTLQNEAFLELCSYLKVGGILLMVECSNEGLENLNTLRRIFDLTIMKPPWHNLYFKQDILQSWQSDTIKLTDTIPFASTYYFLSRVIYAKLARDRGEELRYDSDINLMSLDLPAIGYLGAPRLWIWERVK